MCPPCGHESASIRRVVLALSSSLVVCKNLQPPADSLFRTHCCQDPLNSFRLGPLRVCAEAISPQDPAQAHCPTHGDFSLGLDLLACFGKYWGQDIFRLQSSGSLDCQVPEAINSLG